ncbi:hypothetical protein [Sinimarinibacterium flocculans]|uniref:Uncharacterized protein n=1 Tax=Sinimarinibacterium flocculans TaxID=985250 RepID=A0A318EJP0_9GAMM|nr:hypothetical protein [Sinimarinibacterium flocculans]PXV71401.1 hypothetical protein C8D93_101449 [Sinimarinibacterium flocculans]
MSGATRLLGIVLLGFAGAATAQDEMPAVGGMPQSAGRQDTGEAGTTIIGERESPIGLYIMPWRDARPEPDMDRPARLLQEELLPVDEQVFVRQIEYHNALSGALKQKGIVTPGGR